jgi:uncharacterized protein YprB with RNaseH-like and TPR domain
MPPTFADRIRAVLDTSEKGSGGVYVDSAAETPPDPFSDSAGADLESVLGGEWRRCDSRSCFVVETRRDPSWLHGDAAVGTLATRLEEAAAGAALVAGEPAPLPFVFFDLETTGLSGGAGTYAFLAGCGWFDDAGAFVTRQYLLVRFADERSLLASVAAELARAGALVSFNGKSFDRPLLETRFLYHRLDWTGARRPHVDMLHVARRFWRRHDGVPAAATAPEAGCSLIALERHLLGTIRRGDVPGFEIPSRYFHFVRTGDARRLRAVFEHNRLDLLSLAALTVRVLHLVRVGPDGTDDPREALALGWLYARGGLERRAHGAYQRAVELCVGNGRSDMHNARCEMHNAQREMHNAKCTMQEAHAQCTMHNAVDASGTRGPRLSGGTCSAVHLDALRSLALARRRERAYEEAAGYWRQVLDLPGCPRHAAREASEALAMHHEHRLRDLATAKGFALRSLEDGTHPAWNEAVRHRLARIERKIGRLGSRGSRLAFPEAAEAPDITPET